jgi:ethanolamine ammonia-lyase small subunit
MSEADTPVTSNPWQDWRAATPARLALGRAGAGMPTDETLRFGWAHAMARDAIHTPLDVTELITPLKAQGWQVKHARSRAEDRTTYLRRPDLGRQLHLADAQQLQALNVTGDVCIVLGDGLSSLAIARHAAPFLAALRQHLPADTRYTPLTIATQARVALGDEVGEIFRAKVLVMLIGERPGLSAPDSLGLYLTHGPKRGRTDAERNCISNVRPEGLAYDAAAFKLAWLMREATRRSLSGVALKDESDDAVLAAPSTSAIIQTPP